jgi:phospholipase/carboxylesterase
MSNDLNFIHRFEPGNRLEAPPLLLLHGTGGDENDLLPLGQAVAPGSALLSVRGKVLEHGMPRFFRRLAEGVFDEDEVRSRADELADFVADARKRYGLAAPIALGFSNGANVAAAMLMLRPETLAGAMLVRPMVTLQQAPQRDPTGRPVLMLSGSMDPIVPASNARRLVEMLTEAGADVRHLTLPVGHQLSQLDLARMRDWLRDISSDAAQDPRTAAAV